MGILDKVKEKASGLKDAAGDKIKEMVNEINSNLPMIKEAGYEMNELEIVLRAIPAIIPHFYKVSDASNEKIEEIIKANEGKRFLLQS